MAALASIKICSCFALALNRAGVTAMRDQVLHITEKTPIDFKIGELCHSV